MRAEMSRVARVTGELTRTLGRAPSNEQIAQLSGLSLKRLHLVGAVPGEPLSLDMPLGEDASLTLQDSLEDGGAVSPAQSLYATDLAESVQIEEKALAKLRRLRVAGRLRSHLQD